MSNFPEAVLEKDFTLRAKLRKLFRSRDFYAAAMAGLLVLLFAPDWVSLTLAKEVLSITVSVLAIIFSVFFAGVAVIITAGDNDFIAFLQLDGTFTRILWSYKATLMILFGALVFSLGFLLTVLVYSEMSPILPSSAYVPKWALVALAVASVWALFAALGAAADAILYANLRVRYIAATSSQTNTGNKTDATSRHPDTPSPAPPIADARCGPDQQQ